MVFQSIWFARCVGGGFARTFRVFTLRTLTLNSSCTALRIWWLAARRSATTVY